MKRTVFFVSDSTGITAETIGHTLLTQFDDLEYREVTVPFVSEQRKARETVASIDAAARCDGVRPIVFSTLTDSDLYETVMGSNALVLDLFSVFIRPLEIELKSGSKRVRGRSHGILDRASYDVRIEAVDFALNHDDGTSVRHYGNADVVLVGVSRTGKTPTCVYLAMQFGIRAGNYPLTEDDMERVDLPKVLHPFQERLFGLTIDPERLQQIRTERRPSSRYASLAQCRREVTEVEQMFRRRGIEFLNTSNISIEEIASRVLLKTGLQRRLF